MVVVNPNQRAARPGGYFLSMASCTRWIRERIESRMRERASFFRDNSEPERPTVIYPRLGKYRETYLCEIRGQMSFAPQLLMRPKRELP